MAVFHQNVVLAIGLILQIPQPAIDTIVDEEDDARFNGGHQASPARWRCSQFHLPAVSGNR